MTEIRQNLRFNSLDLEDMNRIMGQLSDRLDELEGRRGDPAFYADVNYQGKRLLNVSGMATGGDTPQTESANTTFSNKVSFSLPPNIPVIESSSKPTTANLPNSGDMAIWKLSSTNYRLVFNGDGTIWQAQFIL